MNKREDQIVFTNGCFDVLHVGHFNLLLFCRLLAGDLGKVIVGLDSDEKILKDKGGDRPIYSFKERSYAIRSLGDDIDLFNGKYCNQTISTLVDEVYKFDSNEELHDLIKKACPDVIVKGSDWTGNVVGSDLAEVIIVPKWSFSTTELIKRINKDV
jgi:cytidyltransferase-like protein